MQPVTLVCAPSGWGKTSLVASWIRDDRAPSRLAYIRFEPGGPPATWQVTRSLVAAGLAIDLVTCEWTGARDGERAVVVLDNVHNVTDPAALDWIERLINRLGEQVAFVVLARTEPPLSLYRWRVRGQLTDLRTDHLSFRPDETADLLLRHGLDLSEQSRDALWQMTEGWPAALCVTVDAIRDRPEPERVIRQLARGETELSEETALDEYVRREILDQLDPDAHDVMLRTSILETVCPGLVEALTGHQLGTRLLAQVSRANSLATFYGGTHSWYRYRRPLRSLLHAELHTVMAEEVPGLHRAAAAWYQANGFPGDALAHTLAAADWLTAERLFAQHWPELIGSSVRALPARCRPHPPDDIGQRPVLALAFATCCRDYGNHPAMTAYVRLAERALGERPPAPYAEMLAGAWLAEAVMGGDFERAAGTAVRLLACTEEASHNGLSGEISDAARSAAFITIAGTRLAVRDLDTAELALQQGFELARESGAGLLNLVAQRQQAYAHLGRGKLSAASASARMVIDGARDAGIVESRNISFARLVLASVSIERNLLDEAEYHLEQAVAASLPHDLVAWGNSAMPLARLHFARGEFDEATVAMGRLRDRQIEGGKSKGTIPPATEAAMLLLDADMLVRTGQLARARELLADSRVTGPMLDGATLASARVDLLEGRPAVAATAARQVASGPLDSVVTAIDAAVLLAEALRELGEVDNAVAQIDRALRLAGPDGIRRPFVGHGTWIAKLLADQGESTAGAGRSVSGGRAGQSGTAGVPATPATPAAAIPSAANAAPATGTPVAGPPAAGILIQPLTERETMVLRYLRSVLSVAEIASMLGVSRNTVKTHVRHVYRKLGVTRRRDAVRRARELRLL